jgi:hypothetical protein
MMAFVIGVVLCVVIVLLGFMSKNTCSKQSVVTKIVGIQETSPKNTALICNFFIKSSYNSCATGNFLNGWVNTCALDRVIKYGCRVLDFEVYCVNGIGVIATSNSVKFTEKGTYNSLPIGEVLEFIRNHAVSNSISTESCPNPHDPLFLHFRMKTNIEDVYNELARSIASNLGNSLLTTQYNIRNYNDFCSTMRLQDLMGKVIIIVDRTSIPLQSSALGELINIVGNGSSFHSWSYNDVVFSPDEGIADFNSLGNMTYCYPPLSVLPTNYSSVLVMKHGVQMCGLCFQNVDTHLKTYNAIFDEQQSAFILKSTGLYTPQEVVADPLRSTQQLAGDTGTIASRVSESTASNAEVTGTTGPTQFTPEGIFS